MAFGAAEDVVRAPDLVSAKAEMTLFRLAGFSSIRVTSQWLPGQVAPTESELTVLRNVSAAAQLSGVKVYLSVYPPGSRSTPLTPEAREEFAAYLTVLAQQLPAIDDVIVGNEPNLNRFWLPQFNPDGSNAASPAYLALLARSYDALKAVDPRTRVWGGALAPRGIDRPGTGRDTHSPVKFLKDMGAAYRASGRTLPIMDGLAFHPYADSSGQSPGTPHPKSTTIGLADYDRLIQTLAGAVRRYAAGRQHAADPVRRVRRRVADPGRQGEALHGSRARDDASGRRDHPGPVLRPGAAARVLPAERRRDPPLPLTGRAGSRRAGSQACTTQTARRRSSLFAVRDALARARGGSIARCDGLALQVASTRVRFPTQAELKRGSRAVQFRCSLDCAWELRATERNGRHHAHAGHRVRPRRIPARRVAEGAQARSRKHRPHADDEPSGQPGSAADACEPEPCAPLTTMAA